MACNTLKMLTNFSEPLISGSFIWGSNAQVYAQTCTWLAQFMRKSEFTLSSQ